MSVDLLFLIRAPASVVRSDEYAEVGGSWKGSDYVIVQGDRWDPLLGRSAARRRALALDLTGEHFRALSAAPCPREIVATTDAAVFETPRSSYVKVRALWLDAGALLLPDVVDAVRGARRVAPLQLSDIGIPLPRAARRPRLEPLDVAYAFRLMGSRPTMSLAGARAGVLRLDIASDDLEQAAEHYRSSLVALGIQPKIARPSKWLDEVFVQLRGRGGGVVTSVQLTPRVGGGIDVAVLWIATQPRAKA